MDTYTGMAVDAFRKVEGARRRLTKAEAESHAAASRIPLDELDLYFAHTELIRFEMDRRDAHEAGDRESVEACDALIVRTRDLIKTLESSHA